VTIQVNGDFSNVKTDRPDQCNEHRRPPHLVHVQLRQRWQPYGGQESNGTTRTTWTYDASYQLRHELRNGANAFDVTHTYDAAGNRTVMVDSGTRTTWTYNAGNQPLTERLAAGTPVTYTYDNTGNRLTKVTNAGTTNFVWDEDSRLTVVKPAASTPVTFTYNAEGKRMKKEA
jgi:YD repeat-containing protein